MMGRSNQPMPRKKSSLDRLRWFVDYDAVARNEPGLAHSFVASLATALDYAGYVIADSIRRAKSLEERALSHISSYLEETDVA